jgi:hypothetical protein
MRPHVVRVTNLKHPEERCNNPRDVWSKTSVMTASMGLRPNSSDTRECQP